MKMKQPIFTGMGLSDFSELNLFERIISVFLEISVTEISFHAKILNLPFLSILNENKFNR